MMLVDITKASLIGLPVQGLVAMQVDKRVDMEQVRTNQINNRGVEGFQVDNP